MRVTRTEPARLARPAEGGPHALRDTPPRLARVADPDPADFAMVDLDPSEGSTWEQVKEVAMTVRRILDDLGLEGFPKTTGSRGIHVLVPVARRHALEETR